MVRGQRLSATWQLESDTGNCFWPDYSNGPPVSPVENASFIALRAIMPVLSYMARRRLEEHDRVPSSLPTPVARSFYGTAQRSSDSLLGNDRRRPSRTGASPGDRVPAVPGLAGAGQVAADIDASSGAGRSMDGPR